METPELFDIIDEDGIPHRAVGPTQGRDKLVAPLVEYFADPWLWVDVPASPIVVWFALDEQGRKDCIRRRAQERCTVTGKASREVHETFTRGAYGGAALVPWNMDVFYPAIHDQLQAHQLNIIHFDPLDTMDMNIDEKRGVLIMFGMNGHVTPQKDLWIYHRIEWRQAKEDITVLQNEIPSVRKMQWDIAKRLKNIKDCEGSALSGFDDIYSLAASYGISSPRTKSLIRMADFISVSDLGELLESVDIDIADQLRKLPEEDLTEVLGWFAELTPAQAWDNFHKKYPPKTSIPKFRVMKREPYKEIRAQSIEEVEHGPDDMVIRGGSVIIGITEEEGS